jgi:hypothetical protein
MMAALICVVSLAAFLQFFVSYCRSILATTREVELSERVREVSGIHNASVAADDFGRLRQLLHLCLEGGRDRKEIRAIEIYYRLLRILGRMSHSTVPSVSSWVDEERRSCSYFAAVVLDRRISENRDMFNRQLDNGL